MIRNHGNRHLVLLKKNDFLPKMLTCYGGVVVKGGLNKLKAVFI